MNMYRRASQYERSEAMLWPSPIKPIARYGLAGDIVRLIEPHSEADPVALLSQILVAFGNVIGRTAHFIAEADEHYLNLFAVMTGSSSKGRKGTSLGQVRRLFKQVDEGWERDCIQSGLSSGEGMIYAVRDSISKEEAIRDRGIVKDYQLVTVDGGADDKRLLVVEPEFASTLRVLGREGNTLSPQTRQAWDTGTLRVLTKNSPVQATGAHISIIGHITRDELRRYLSTTEAGNGFANRFLWFCVQRSKFLPEGGELHKVDFEPLIRRLSQAVSFAQTVGEMRRDEEARELWSKVYRELSEGKAGLVGSVTSRAEAQVMRLACLYALLDCSQTIRTVHLQAAVALWEYCEASAEFIFGDSLGNTLADEILQALRESPFGMTRTQIRDLFKRNRTARNIAAALSQLEQDGLACPLVEAPDGPGRPTERWVIFGVADGKDGLSYKGERLEDEIMS